MILTTLMLFSAAFVRAQDGVVFRYRTLDSARAEARSGKLVFVDVYAVWCKPCAILEKEIFSRKNVGDYINENFVTCRLDADSEQGKAFMQQNGINRLPSLVILDANGEILQAVSGFMDDYSLLRFCMSAKGETPDMEKIYKVHRKDKKNPDKMQAVLLEAPYFMQTVTGETQMNKWRLRIEDVFKLYIDTKGVENMGNPTDFRLLTIYHNFYEKDDPIIDKIVRHFRNFSKGLNEEIVARYVTDVHIRYITGLASRADKRYEPEVERITSDMLHVYSAIQNDAESFKQSISEFCMAAVALWNKDMDAYIRHTDTYFMYIPNLTYNDYAMAIENMYNKLDEKLDKNSAEAVLKWGGKAIEMNPEVEAMASMKMVMGDAYKALSEPKKAKEMYDVAFQLMMTSKKTQFIQNLQPQIKKRLEGLKHEN